VAIAEQSADELNKAVKALRATKKSSGTVLISTLFGLVFSDYFALRVGLSDCFDRAG
jgi:hypothetical protein